MRLVHLATFDAHGGAAVAMLRLADSQARAGDEVRVLVREKSTSHPLVHAVEGDAAQPRTNREIAQAVWLLSTRGRAPQAALPFSPDAATYDVASHPFVADADVLHLHWVAGFVSSDELRRLQALGKPIVWTLHDQLPFTGGCHYSQDCAQFTKTCRRCPQLVEDARALASLSLAQKRTHVDPRAMVVASPSRWLAKLAKASAMFARARVEVVPYGIDVEARRRVTKDEARRRLDIPAGATVLFASSINNKEARKGGTHLADALAQIDVPGLVVVAAGEGSRLGLLAPDDPRLEWAYRAADVFVLPTLEDNLPNTLLEAMAAELPVVAYRTGGIPDFLEDNVNGRLVRKGDRTALAGALQDVLTDSETRRRLAAAAGATAAEAFDAPIQAARYAAIYKDAARRTLSTRKRAVPATSDVSALTALLNDRKSLRLLASLHAAQADELQQVIAARGGEIRDLTQALMTHETRTVIYGAGSAGQHARAALERLGARRIVAFADGDARKVGTTVGGVHVVGADALNGDWFDDVVVASQAWREITTSLLGKGVPREKLFVYQPGDGSLKPMSVQEDTSAPNVLVLTDDCVSPGHGIGAVLLRHLANYPKHRLSHVYLRRKGDPFWANSYNMSEIAPADIAAKLAASGHAPDVIYANVFGEPGLEALDALIDAFGADVPVIQHFHDWLYADQASFERVLRNVSPRISELWAITDALGAQIGAIVGRGVSTVNTFKCEIAPAYKRDHRGLDERFKVVMLGNSHMPWTLHHVRNVWRGVREQMPGLGPIQWFGYPTSALYVKEAGVEIEPEIEYYGYLNDRVLHRHLCDADLALVPFNIADTPEYHYAAHSVPSRITEFLNAGLPIIAAAGRGTETYRFITGHGIGVCGTIADERAFTETLVSLMRDTAARLDLSRRGRTFAESHCDVRKHQEMLVNSFIRVSARRQAVRSADTLVLRSA